MWHVKPVNQRPEATTQVITSQPLSLVGLEKENNTAFMQSRSIFSGILVYNSNKCVLHSHVGLDSQVTIN